MFRFRRLFSSSNVTHPQINPWFIFREKKEKEREISLERGCHLVKFNASLDKARSYIFLCSGKSGFRPAFFKLEFLCVIFVADRFDDAKTGELFHSRPTIPLASRSIGNDASSGGQPRRRDYRIFEKRTPKMGSMRARDLLYPFRVRYRTLFQRYCVGRGYVHPRWCIVLPLHLLILHQFVGRSTGQSFPYCWPKKLHHEDLMRRDHLCETKRAVLQHYYP